MKVMYYYWFYFPSKKGRSGRRHWRPLGDLAEYNNDLTNVEAASSSGTETDSSGEEEELSRNQSMNKNLKVGRLTMELPDSSVDL